jgi:MurNAc alpha-1-phosphate uridylyltransferase
MKTAILLAAGRGERLRPLTDITPKPMCKVHGKPLIEYHLSHLAAAGYQDVIINHAYLGDQIRRFVGDGSQWGVTVRYAPEPPGALETGGGLYNIIQRFQLKKPFITVNADIFTDYSFVDLALPKHSLAHLILVPQPNYFQQADFGLNQQGKVVNEPKTLILAGMIAYNPEVFLDAHYGRYSVTPLLRNLVAKQQVSGELFQGVWEDMGSVARLNAVNQEGCPPIDRLFAASSNT